MSTPAVMQPLRLMVNGQQWAADQPALFADERAFHYGDGVFETMLLLRGRIRFLSDHWQRLQLGCERLRFAAPAQALLDAELQTLIAGHHAGVVKLLVSRGRSERGYRLPEHASPTRLWQLFPAPIHAPAGLRLRWCEMRWSRNPYWQGSKHCNRLEQVMAQSEWRDAAALHEGLMLDTEDELVSGTQSNVFLMLDNVLVTPDLRYSGIQGVMRKNVLRLAEHMALPCEQRAVRAEEIVAAQEAFMTNAVRGIQPVLELELRRWPVGPVTQQLMAALERAS